MIVCALVMSLTGCSARDWQALLGNWFESACHEAENCTRICPNGDRPAGPIGTC